MPRFHVNRRQFLGSAAAISGCGGGKASKGGKLVTANAETGTYVAESVLPDGSTWTSEPGKKIDTVDALPWA